MIALEQSSYMGKEGDGYLTVCVEISEVPAGGQECDIVVYLEATDGTAGKWDLLLLVELWK